MLDNIVAIINSSNHQIDHGTIFCYNYKITDISIIDFLDSKNILENIINSRNVGDTITLELNLARLNSIGFYEDCKSFIIKNKYQIPTDLFYILELKCYSTDFNEFICKYNSIINLIDSIKNIAKHSYKDIDIDNSVILKEDSSAFISFIYDASDIKSFKIENINNLNSLSLLNEEKFKK